MKTFLINLDKNQARLDAMTAQFEALGVEFERFPAIYGKELPKNEMKKHFARWRSMLAMRRDLSLGEIGCALSHVEVYRKIVEQNLPCAVVIEDDVILDSRYLKSVAQAEEFYDPEKPQVFVFSGFCIKGAESFPEEVRLEDAIWCADAYCITRAAAKLLLRLNYPVITVADAFKRWSRYFGLELYHVFPSTAKQDNEQFGSDLHIPKKFNWLTRQVLWIIDRLLIAILNR